MAHAKKKEFSTRKYPVFEQIKSELISWDIMSVAKAANVAPATIYFWLDGRTHSPNIRTLSAVAVAIGFEIILQRSKSAKPELRIIK